MIKLVIEIKMIFLLVFTTRKDEEKHILLNKVTLKNASHRLGMPKSADVTKARALATRRGKHLKLNISCDHVLINWEMSVYFDNIGLVLQLIEKLV